MVGSVEPPASLALGFQDARLKCAGHVSYKQESFPHLAGHTDLTAKVKGTSLDLTLALGREGGGADAPPVASLPVCALDVGAVSLDFDGGLTSQLLDLFSAPIEKLPVQIPNQLYI